MLRALVAAGLLLAVAGGATAAPVRVCLLADNPPYGERASGGGFDLEVARAALAASGREVEAVWTGNARRIQELEETDLPLHQLARGGCDLLMSVPGPAADSLRGTRGLTLGAPYYGVAFELLGCAADDTADLGALHGERVGVQAESIAHVALRRFGAEPALYFTPEEALAALARGEDHHALLWGPSAGWLLARGEPAPGCGFVRGYAPPQALRWNAHVATRVADEDLRETLNTSLARLRAEGELDTIARRHGVPLHPPFATTYDRNALRALGNGR